ncbi:hypothetical protein F5X68DRAFT_255040 [Plectosphaerella plurivora]|uniref:Extracellular serine-rich protein n=1 Tax=Plectosphaerella plurivora TaxID=936078 RepID=A0A9P8VFW9_9PEZI|nr:hypothetical protein F5X68DRAFT_255040 [Plectosphaerella plurivora]
MSGIGRVGFNSGFKPVKAITTDAPRWSITINDTEPIFYFCGADGSCYKNHMIGVINPNTTQTLQKHLESAEGLTFQVLPGEPYPEEKGDDPTEPKPTPDGDGGQGTSSPPSGGGGDTGLYAGQIAGIAIGSAALLIITASLIYLCGRRGGIDGAHRRIAFTGHPPPGGMTEENYTVGTKSPAVDSSRWSAVRWSTRGPLSPYREQASPPNLSMLASPVHAVGHPHPGYGFTGMEPQHPGHYQHASYMYDHAMKQQANSPPPKPVASPPPVTPIELPSENGLSPGQARYSWVGNDSEANFRTR